MLPRLGWVFSLITATLVGLARAAPLDAGTASFTYGTETFSTYYQVFGREGGTKTPLIVLHGGPGMSYDYLQTLRDLSGRPILFYDQIGGGRSSHLGDKPDSFWTVDLFVKQLESLISHFCLEKYDVLGHSWGGMLASEFAVTQPEGLKKLVLSNSPPSTELWGRSQAKLISTFEPSVQQSLMQGWADPNHKEALLQYFSVHGNTLNPWPQDLTTSFNFLFSDPSADAKMWTGPLHEWTIVDRLSKIQVPTLVVNGGANDITQDYVIRPLLDGIPNAQHHKFEGSTHTPFLEERPAFMEVVGNFLDS